MVPKYLLISICVAATSYYFEDIIRGYITDFLKFSRRAPEKTGERLFTSDELKLYNGIDKPELYLAVLGKVFDVSKGEKFYGKGNAYHFFTGKDSSRSFVTGEFSDDKINDKVADLKQQDLRSIGQWIGFYQKDYKRVGKLIGTYYNEQGKLTPYGREVRNLIKSAERAKEESDKTKLQFPPCNVEWNAEHGTRVWCTDKSGGIERDWIGVPRQFYEAGTKDYKCVCVNDNNLNLGNLKEYEGCESSSQSCFVTTEI